METIRAVTQSELRRRANTMRRNPTKAERVFMGRLGAQGIRFIQQYIVKPFIADIFISDTNILVEIDGNSHEGREEYDRRRDAYLAAKGYRIIRIPNERVKKYPLGGFIGAQRGPSKFARKKMWKRWARTESGKTLPPAASLIGYSRPGYSLSPYMDKTGKPIQYVPLSELRIKR